MQDFTDEEQERLRALLDRLPAATAIMDELSSDPEIARAQIRAITRLTRALSAAEWLFGTGATMAVWIAKIAAAAAALAAAWAFVRGSAS